MPCLDKFSEECSFWVRAIRRTKFEYRRINLDALKVNGEVIEEGDDEEESKRMSQFKQDYFYYSQLKLKVITG